MRIISVFIYSYTVELFSQKILAKLKKKKKKGGSEEKAIGKGEKSKSN